jgi:hypothetical protein
VLFRRRREDSGSSLIWFISVLALVVLYLGVLVSASSQFLAARQVADLTEQFALSLKTQLNIDSTSSIDFLGRNLFAYIAPKYRLDNLHVKSVRLESGKTVHAVICSTWQDPFPGINLSREICEEAFAR